MSSFDIFFAARPGVSPPTIDAIRAWLAARPRWRVGDSSSGAEYQNPLTGLDMEALLEADEEAPADRVPATLWVSGLRAHNAFEEVADELEAFARAFDLLVIEDRDTNPNTTRPFDRAWLSAEHEAFNVAAHAFQFGHQAGDYDAVLDRERLDEVLAWNKRRDARAAASGDDVFVPQILFFQRQEDVGTFVAWADGVAARIPPVDAIQTTRAFVPWSAIADALSAAGATREDDHWLVTGDALAAVFAAVDGATSEPPPELVAPRDVLTRELVAAHLLPPPERARRREALDHLHEGRMASFHGRSPADAVKSFVRAADLQPEDLSIQIEAARFLDEKDPDKAVRLAERTLALAPDYAFVALLGAMNALYAAHWDKALAFADRVIALTPDDRDAQLVRATALTELLRADEAVAACQRALEIEDDAMAQNVAGFTLAAAGRHSEAEAAYTNALRVLDSELAENPDDADAELHQRRAYALLGLGRAKEALDAARKAVSLDDDNTLAWMSVGRAALELGRGPEAVKALRKVMDRRREPMAAFHLARAHALTGKANERDIAITIARKSPRYSALVDADASLSSG